MTNDETKEKNSLLAAWRTVQRQLKILTIAVMLMALAVFVLAGTVFGYLTNYFSGEAVMYGSSLIGAAIIGFWCGWFARRRA
jgi:hypothetical protein